MSTSFNRAAARGRLHRFALAGMVSFAMIATGGLAAAEDTTTTETSTETLTETSTAAETEVQAERQAENQDETETTVTEPEQPPGLTPFDVSVLADCWPDGFGEVSVFLRIDFQEDVVYEVTLAGEKQEAEFDRDSGIYIAFFTDVAAGVHEVRITGTDGTDITTEANLDKCREEEPPAKELLVSVKCKDGHGVVTIQVYNPDTEESKFLTIEIDDFGALPPYEFFEFFPDVIARITEVGEDGTYEIKLYEEFEEGRELIDSETITIACAVPPTTTTTTTTTTAPPPQGGTPPASGLPDTGAAVGGIAVLGMIALLLGAALVFVGRRRRATAAEGTEV